MDGLASVEGESIQERADDFDKADMMEVSSGGDDKVNQKKDEGKLPVIYVDLTNSD
jgi:pre-mRNA-splicing factor CDC5/CEF1